MNDNKDNVWGQFEEKIFNGFSLISNSKHFLPYLIQTFNDAIDEGILILQPRSFLGWVKDYDSDENISVEKELDMIIEARNEIRKKTSTF